jgi:hypothetical protein
MSFVNDDRRTTCPRMFILPRTCAYWLWVGVEMSGDVGALFAL